MFDFIGLGLLGIVLFFISTFPIGTIIVISMVVQTTFTYRKIRNNYKKLRLDKNSLSELARENTKIKNFMDASLISALVSYFSVSLISLLLTKSPDVQSSSFSCEGEADCILRVFAAFGSAAAEFERSEWAMIYFGMIITVLLIIARAKWHRAKKLEAEIIATKTVNL